MMKLTDRGSRLGYLDHDWTRKPFLDVDESRGRSIRGNGAFGGADCCRDADCLARGREVIIDHKAEDGQDSSDECQGDVEHSRRRLGRCCGRRSGSSNKRGKLEHDDEG